MYICVWYVCIYWAHISTSCLINSACRQGVYGCGQSYYLIRVYEGDLWSKSDIFATFLKCTKVSLLRCKKASPKPFAPTEHHVKHMKWSMTILILLRVFLLRSAQTNPQISADFPQTQIFMRENKGHAKRACASVFISVETVTVCRAFQWINDQIRHNFVYMCHKRQKALEGKSAITIKIIVWFQWKWVQ